MPFLSDYLDCTFLEQMAIEEDEQVVTSECADIGEVIDFLALE